LLSSDPHQCPRLREAATTLAASTGDTTAQTLSADFDSALLDNFALRWTECKWTMKRKIEN